MLVSHADHEGRGTDEEAAKAYNKCVAEDAAEGEER